MAIKHYGSKDCAIIFEVLARMAGVSKG